MNSMFRATPLLGVVLASALLSPACDLMGGGGDDDEHGCGAAVFDCRFEGDAGVVAVLENAVSRFQSDLPTTVTLCVEGKCADASLRLVGDNVVCTSNELACIVLENGSLEIGYGVDLPKAQAAVRVTVENEAGKILLDETQTGTVKETRPNGADCPPVCRESEVSFSAVPGQPTEPETPSM